jgi:hypothetical protein
MTKRRLLTLGLALVVGVLAFTGTSFALGRGGDQPRPREALPAAALPASVLSASEQIAVKNSLGWAEDQFGINDASLSDVRQVARTEAGPIYLVFGSRGACLYLSGTSACGDPGAPDEPLLALGTAHNGVAIGAGIASESVRRVSLSVPGRQSISLPLVNGTFVIPSGLSVQLPSTAGAEHMKLESE